MVASGDLIKTGFTGIDEIIGGFRPGSFNVVEGRLDSEKYVFLLDIIQNILNEGYSVLFISLDFIVYDPSIQKRLSQMLSANQGVFIKAKERIRSYSKSTDWKNVIALSEVFSSSLTVIDADPSYYGRLSNSIAAITTWASCHNGICVIECPGLLTFEKGGRCEALDWHVQRNIIARTLSFTAKETETCIIAFDNATRSFDVKGRMGSCFEDYRQYAEQRGFWFSYCDTQMFFLHLRKDHLSPDAWWGLNGVGSLNWNRNDKARVVVVKNSFGATGETILDYKYEDGVSYFLQSDAEKFEIGLIVQWLYRRLLQLDVYQQNGSNDFRSGGLIVDDLSDSECIVNYENQSLGLSSSRYARAHRCGKSLWLDDHAPELFDASVIDKERIAANDAIVSLAKGYFGDHVEIYCAEFDIETAAQRTKEFIDEKTPVICGATFIGDKDCSCTVDILRVLDGEMHIVKIMTEDALEEHTIREVAYQLLILKQCGISVKSTYVIHINPNYERRGNINVQELFLVEDVTEKTLDRVHSVSIALSSTKQNAVRYDEQDYIKQYCDYPNPCGYKHWCMRKLPKPSVYDLSGISADDAYVLRHMADLTTFQDLYYADCKLNPRQRAQVECEVKGIKEIADCNALTTFLSKLSYPLYFLDIKAEQKAIPPFDGCKPWQFIPTNYSLRVIEKPGLSLPKNHISFVRMDEWSVPGVTGNNEHSGCQVYNDDNVKRKLAEMLCRYIPEDARVIAYSASFIEERIEELAKEFPDLRDCLLGIRTRIVDLSEPFRTGAYYHHNMGGSNSLGAVINSWALDDLKVDSNVFDVREVSGDLVLDGLKFYDKALDVDQLDKELSQDSDLSTKAMFVVYERLKSIARDGKKLQSFDDQEQRRKREVQEVVAKYNLCSSYPRSSNMLAVFWCLDGEFFGLACDRNASEVIKCGRYLDLPYEHHELWDFCKPISCELAYDEVPHGRISFNTATQEFEIGVSSERLVCPEFRSLVINEFDLPTSTSLYGMYGCQW